MNIKVIKRWLPLFVIVALMVAFYLTGLHEKISLQSLQDNKEAMLDYVSERPVIAALSFVGAYIIFVALSLPAATLLTLTGGFLFGKWLGTIYVVSAATVGATIVFFVAKTSLGETLRDKAGGLYKRIEDNMEDGAVGYLLFMRLVPIFPFFLVNIVAALFNVKPRVFILTTFFGIIPGSFVFVNLGTQLATITSLGDLVSMQTLIAFSLLGVFALIPTIYKKVKDHKKTLNSIVFISFLAMTQVYAAEPHQQQFYQHYDGLLKDHVTPTKAKGIEYNGVNYEAWRTDKRHQQALDSLLAIKSIDFKGDEKKAFWINAYNFLTIELIVREQEQESIKNLGGFFTSPWKKHAWPLAGEDYTLDEIEHNILRPMGDARIHFAINCASISCPDLRPEIYKVNHLDEQLKQQVNDTLANTGKGLRKTEDKIYVSKIFNWFAEDFNGGDVKQWLQNYNQIDPSQKLQYMSYDWSLNNYK